MAAKGDIEASNYLDLFTGVRAMMECEGTIPRPALVALKRSADRQNPFAQLQLAMYMMRTNPIDQNALALLTTAAKTGLCEAHFQIGMLHNINFKAIFHEDSNNEKESIRWFIRAAFGGLGDAQMHLSSHYHNGSGKSKHPAKALFYALKASEQGHPRAFSRLGELYHTGKGCEVDLVRSFGYIVKSAELGDETSMFNLSALFRAGKGVEIDLLKSFEWMKKSAAGDAETLFLAGLANKYQYGTGCKKDFKKALRLFERAEKKSRGMPDHEEFLCSLGEVYMWPAETKEVDHSKAFRFISRSAEMGSAKSQNLLSFLYVADGGVKQNFERGFSWMKRATEGGHILSMLNLANFYRQGIKGVCEIDHREAAYWDERYGIANQLSDRSSEDGSAGLRIEYITE
jgi:TPR repeat protein